MMAVTVTGIQHVVALAITSPSVARTDIRDGEGPLHVMKLMALIARLTPQLHASLPPPVEVAGTSAAAV